MEKLRSEISKCDTLPPPSPLLTRRTGQRLLHNERPAKGPPQRRSVEEATYGSSNGGARRRGPRERPAGGAARHRGVPPNGSSGDGTQRSEWIRGCDGTTPYERIRAAKGRRPPSRSGAARGRRPPIGSGAIPMRDDRLLYGVPASPSHWQRLGARVMVLNSEIWPGCSLNGELGDQETTLQQGRKGLRRTALHAFC
ncbi:hypothetical protein EJB05_57165, partial [Eragrostis curvula]